jgi:hypothetical protein
MATVIVNLLPLIAGAAVLPLWVFVTLLMLRSDRGMVKATAFALGAAIVRVLQGFLFGYVFRTAAVTARKRSSPRRCSWWSGSSC